MKPIDRAKILKGYKEEGFNNKEISTRFLFEYGKRLSKGVISTDLKIMSESYGFLAERVELGVISYKVAKILVFLKVEDAMEYLQEFLDNNWSISTLERMIKDKNTRGLNWDIEKNAEELFMRKKSVRSEIGNKKIIIRYKNIKELTEIFKKLEISED